MAMSKNEMKDLTDKKEKQEAEGCSESVASLYDGKPCTYGNMNSCESAQLLLL